MRVCPYFAPLVRGLCLIGYANRQVVAAASSRETMPSAAAAAVAGLPRVCGVSAGGGVK